MSDLDAGPRVRNLIESAGLTHVSVADAIGIDSDKLSKSVNGTRRFTSLELAKLAELFGVTVNSLLGLPEERPAVAARAADVHSVSGDALERLRELSEVRLATSELHFSQASLTLSMPETELWVDQGEQLAAKARQVLAQHDLSTEPGYLMKSIEQAFGIDVCLLDGDGSWDGLSWCEGRSAIVAAATTSTIARQRFTLAHELCHALLSDDQGLVVESIDAIHAKTASEKRANAFAAAFLLPEAVLRLDSRAEDPSLRDFSSLVIEHAVSPSALAWRLYNLGMISRTRVHELGRRSTGECAREVEAFDTLAEWVTISSKQRLPERILTDALRAYFEGRTTLRLFARAAGITPADARTAIESVTSTTDDQGE